MSSDAKETITREQLSEGFAHLSEEIQQKALDVLKEHKDFHVIVAAVRKREKHIEDLMNEIEKCKDKMTECYYLNDPVSANTWQISHDKCVNKLRQLYKTK